jgi:hypothetical protein
LLKYGQGLFNFYTVSKQEVSRKRASGIDFGFQSRSIQRFEKEARHADLP